MSVIEYYNILNSLWLDLIYYQNFQMKCSEDVTMLQKLVERERIFEFLVGLNVEHDQVRVQILGKETLSSLIEVFSIVKAEASRRIVMLEAPPSEGSTPAVVKPDTGQWKNGVAVGETNWKNETHRP